MNSSKTIAEGYLKKQDWRVKENSNSPYSYGGLGKHMISEVSKDYWLREVYPEHITSKYLNGEMHIHDLGGLTIYCCGYSLKNIITMGVQGIPNIPTSSPAKHFDAILNQIANLVTVYQNEIMGAVAFSSFDTLLAPFVKVDELKYREVKQSMQNFIFSINSNSRGGAEPAFSNITLDLTPPKDLLNEYAIIGSGLCDFTYKECQREMDMINRAFCELMIKGDANGRPFAYPIPTYNIHDRFDWDNKNNQLLWEMAGKYGYPYFANFLNSDMKPEDTRSMCPLHSTENVLIYNDYLNEYTISNVKNMYSGNKKDHGIYNIVLNGEIKKARLNKFDNIEKFYEITTINGHKIKVSDNHLNLTLNGVKKTSELTCDDYLPFNTTPILGKGLTYNDGLIVGAFLGDGSFNDSNGIVYSLNETTKQELLEHLMDDARIRFGAKISLYQCTSPISEKQSCVNLKIISKMFRGLIEEFVSGDNAINKCLSVKCLNRSVEFRQGIIDGLYKTDGGNSNRIYSSSKNMIDSLVTLFMSLGYSTRIDVDNRTMEEGHLSDNPVYCIRFYSMNTNRKTMPNLYIKDDEYMWFKIDSIKEIGGNIGYCFEVLNDEEPYFTMPNGLVTHNCRLRLNLKELKKRNGGLFGSGDSTGSIGVVTINAPRIVYLNKGNETAFFNHLDNVLEAAKDSLEIKRKWLQKNVIETRLIPAFCTYVGTIQNHFSTIGIVGMNEMCENFFDDGTDILSDKGKAFALKVGEHIRTKLIEFQEETGNLYNYEATPAESTAYRLAQKDKKEYPDIITRGTIKAPYYTNSCHIPVSKIKGIKETFDHQEDLQIQFTGGTVIHIFCNSAISPETAKSIIKTVCENYKVPYVSISPLNRYCPEHGYIADDVDECPICRRKVQKYQRITGYLRCIDNFNDGKRSEFEERNQLKLED